MLTYRFKQDYNQYKAGQTVEGSAAFGASTLTIAGGIQIPFTVLEIVDNSGNKNTPPTGTGTGAPWYFSAWFIILMVIVLLSGIAFFVKK